MYVVNLAKSTENYGHFLLISTLLNDDDNKLNFLCSAATCYDEYSEIKGRVDNFTREYKCGIYEFPYRCQDFNTTSCGIFVMLNSFLVSRGMSGEEIFDCFYREFTNDDDSASLYKLEIYVCESSSVLFRLKEGTLQKYVYDLNFLNGQANYEKRLKQGFRR